MIAHYNEDKKLNATARIRKNPNRPAKNLE